MAIFSYVWLHLVMKCYMAILGYLLLYVAAVHEYIWINHCQSGRGEMEVTGCQPIMDHLQAAYSIRKRHCNLFFSVKLYDSQQV